MGSIAIGLVLVAVGAVMRFAIYAPNQHANWGTIGLILMIVAESPSSSAWPLRHRGVIAERTAT